jgi:hypothetical protein
MEMEQLTLAPHTKMQPKDRLVYLVTTDHHYGAFLAQQIGHFGYFVQIVKDLKGLENAIAEHISTAILVDIPALEKEMTIKISSRIRFFVPSIPMFISITTTKHPAESTAQGSVFAKPIE